MGLIKYIKKDNNGNELRYYCSKCEKLIGIIYQPHSHFVTLDFPNNCPNCNKQIMKAVTIYEPIIDEVIYD